MKPHSTIYEGPFGEPHPAVKGVLVDWMPSFAGWPDIALLVERSDIPDPQGFRYEQRDRVFVGVHPLGWRRQYCHSGLNRNEGGFGGHEFVITMQEGGNRILQGPWSGSAQDAHQQGFPRMQEVTLQVPGQRTGYAGYFLPEEVLAATLRHHLPHLEIRVAPICDGTHLEVALPQWHGTKEEAVARAGALGLDTRNMHNWMAGLVKFKGRMDDWLDLSRETSSDTSFDISDRIEEAIDKRDRDDIMTVVVSAQEAPLVEKWSGELRLALLRI